MKASQAGNVAGDSIPHVAKSGVHIVQLQSLAHSVEGPPLLLRHEGYLILRLTISGGLALDACTPAAKGFLLRLP